MMAPKRDAPWELTAASAAACAAFEGLLLTLPSVGLLLSLAPVIPEWAIISAAMVCVSASAAICGLLAWYVVQHAKTTAIASSRVLSGLAGFSITAVSFAAPMVTVAMYKGNFLDCTAHLIWGVPAAFAGILHLSMAAE